MSLPPSKWTRESPEVADVAYWGGLDPPTYAEDPEVIDRIRANQERLKPSSPKKAPVAEALVGRVMAPRPGRDIDRVQALMPLADLDAAQWLAEVDRYDVEVSGDFVEGLVHALRDLTRAGFHELTSRYEDGLVEGRFIGPGGDLVDLRFLDERKWSWRESAELVEAGTDDATLRAEGWAALREWGVSGELAGTWVPIVFDEPLGLYRVGADFLMERMTPDGWVEDKALLQDIRSVEVERIGPDLAGEIERQIARRDTL